MTNDDRFQFHTGSIKSPCSLLAHSTSQCFNSILVRLKDYLKLIHGCITHYLFQFHTGSIKSEKGNRSSCYGQNSFNSILVRLKVSLLLLSRQPHLVFQFHTGSIKSHAVRDNRTQQRVVSIPYWFD